MPAAYRVTLLCDHQLNFTLVPVSFSLAWNKWVWEEWLANNRRHPLVPWDPLEQLGRPLLVPLRARTCRCSTLPPLGRPLDRFPTCPTHLRSPLPLSRSTRFHPSHHSFRVSGRIFLYIFYSYHSYPCNALPLNYFVSNVPSSTGYSLMLFYSGIQDVF